MSKTNKRTQNKFRDQGGKSLSFYLIQIHILKKKSLMKLTKVTLPSYLRCWYAVGDPHVESHQLISYWLLLAKARFIYFCSWLLHF
jgi:hypothetical protein